MIRRRGSFAAVLTGVVLIGAPAAFADDPGEPFLATVRTELAADVTLPLPARIRATLHVHYPDRVAAALDAVAAVDVVAKTADSVTVDFGRIALVSGAPRPDDRAASFVIDFEEPAVRQLVATAGARPDIDALAGSVHEHISNKTYSQGFDFASRVAATAAGDCTEHAVLLAALARAHGYPARVVFGFVLIDNAARVGSFGHAWTEIHDGTDWRLVDATLPTALDDTATTRYVPLGLLDNEGPGYTLALMQVLGRMPARISAVKVAE